MVKVIIYSAGSSAGLGMYLLLCPGDSDDTNYTIGDHWHKKAIISGFPDQIRPEAVWNLGANIGVFIRRPAEQGIATVAIDADPSAAGKNTSRRLRRAKPLYCPCG